MLQYFITGLYSLHGVFPTPKSFPMLSDTLIFTLHSVMYTVRVLPVAVRRTTLLKKVKHNSSVIYPDKRLGIHGKY